MRPDRFERLLTDAINHDKRLTARTYSEAGFTRSPHGITATIPGCAPVNVQIVGRLADGERHDHPAPPVASTPHPDLPIPDPTDGRSLSLAALEQYLVGLAVAAAPAETASVRLYQDRDTPGAVRYGATITYHNGATIYLYILSAGSSRHEDFTPPATVNA
ncbi:hypothetical protein JL475_00720 [Streptomyces sp. M2CJ-2]|uniref:hypothetical protein n=1 Tax=Streptomyces sp. M2CJ-2 TaxID=2803948 RepID=UPI001920FE3D|nr:hypothetical protein [Streptomyces sp. M2CJ-2]MBL3664570.1 hypothetical protein [Streptomyces sp. M2CJ-2]